MYANHFKDNFFMLWNIESIENIEQYNGTALMPKCTTVEKKQYIKKEVYNLPNDLSKKLYV
jgi:hypothetical protein